MAAPGQLGRAARCGPTAPGPPRCPGPDGRSRPGWTSRWPSAPTQRPRGGARCDGDAGGCGVVAPAELPRVCSRRVAPGCSPRMGGRRLVGGSGQPLCPIPGSGRGEPGLGAEWVLQPLVLPTSISFMGWEQGQKGLGRGAEQALLPVQHKPSATVPGSTTLGALGGGQEGPAVTSGNAAAAGVGSQGPEASAGPTAPGLGAGLGDAEQGRGDAAGAGRQQEGGCSPRPPFGHRHQVGSCTLPSSSGSCSAAGLVLSPAATGSPLPTSPRGCGGPDSGTGAVGAGGLPSPQAGVLSACSRGSRCRGAVDRSRRSEPRYQRPRAGNWILQIQSGALGREFSP